MDTTATMKFTRRMKRCDVCGGRLRRARCTSNVAVACQDCYARFHFYFARDGSVFG